MSPAWNNGHDFRDACRLWRICRVASEKAQGHFPPCRRDLEFIDLPEHVQAAFAEAAWTLRHRKPFADYVKPLTVRKGLRSRVKLGAAALGFLAGVLGKSSRAL